MRKRNSSQAMSGLPPVIAAAYQRIDNRGNSTGEIIVELSLPEQTVTHEIFPVASLVAPNPQTFATILLRAQLLDYAELPLLRRLCRKILDTAKRPAYVADHDGHHQIEFNGEILTFQIWRGKRYLMGTAPDSACKIIVMARNPAPAPSCTLENWTRSVGVHLVQNDYALVAVCFALAPLLCEWLNLPRLALSIDGRSSRGKSTLLRALQSMIEPPDGTHSASGTAAGIRAALWQGVDRPMFLDELAQCSDFTGLVNILFDLANGAGKVVSDSAQSVKRAAPPRFGLITTNEKPLREELARRRVQASEGFGARLLEISIQGDGGIFERLPKDMDARQLTDAVSASARTHYGALWPAWVKAVAKEHARILRFRDVQLPKIEAALGEGFHVESPVVARLVRGVAAAALAGCVAAQLKLLPTDRQAIIKAMRRVLSEHLGRQVGGVSTTGAQVVQKARDVLDRNRNRFPPFAEFDVSGSGAIYGYRVEQRGETFFLFLSPAFEELFGGFGVRFAAEALHEAGFLAKDKEGLQRQIRVPGRANEKPKRFYAIRENILFDGDELASVL